MADDPLAHLRGSCACDRNQYSIALPKSRPALASAEVYLDSSRANRWAHEPLYLRIPLSWYESATYAAYPDESHAAIRRSFHTPFGRPRRRQFCGFCGTGLVSWDEEGSGEWVDVLVGSLGRESVGVLEEVGLLGGMSGEDEEEEGGESGQGDVVLRAGEEREVGVPYYEEVTDMGRRGKIRRRKGGQTSEDGGTTVDWEVVELEGGEDGDLVMEESVVEHSAGSSFAGANKRLKTSD